MKTRSISEGDSIPFVRDLRRTLMKEILRKELGFYLRLISLATSSWFLVPILSKSG